MIAVKRLVKVSFDNFISKGVSYGISNHKRIFLHRERERERERTACVDNSSFLRSIKSARSLIASAIAITALTFIGCGGGGGGSSGGGGGGGESTKSIAISGSAGSVPVRSSSSILSTNVTTNVVPLAFTPQAAAFTASCTLALSSSECVLVGKLQAGSKVFNLAGLYLLNDDRFALVGSSSNGDFYTIEGVYDPDANGGIKAGSATIGGNVEGTPIVLIDVSGEATPPTIGDATEGDLDDDKQIPSALQGEWLLCEEYQKCEKLVVTALGVSSYKIRNTSAWVE
ncbi:MAG: hypothetical protein LBQ52_03895, partial [Helicobacteraceae bacterium]|nr:hypothetical protein [Helicobacteraceae bacterium]